VIASPGAGKTSLIEQTLPRLKGRLRVAAVDGDIATSLDSDRAAAAGAGAAIQINTGGDCHLDAVMLRGALDQLDLPQFDLLIVENVGNLVCPANFKLGTHKTVLIASIPKATTNPTNIRAPTAAWTRWSSTRSTSCPTSHSGWTTSNRACKCSTPAS
jgi:hydrogenase nickel incorporation protein HypB